MEQIILEGTGEEISRYTSEHPRRQFKLISVPEKNTLSEQELASIKAMRKALKEIAESHEGRRYTSGENTDKMIREARDGGMYGDDSDKR